MKRFFLVFILLMAFLTMVSAQDGVAASPAGVAAVADDTVGEESGTMERLISFCLDNLNYGTVALFMTIESSFIPFPSEVVVPPAAWLSADPANGMNVFLVVFFATLGAVLGALINYLLALWLGRPIIYRFANSRFGHMCLIDEPAVKKAEAYFDERGALSTFIGRLIPAVRQLISIPAGLARMKMSTFLLFTALGAGMWNSILALLGWYMSKVPGIETKEQLIERVTEYSSEIGYCFIALGVFIVGYLIYKGCKK